MVRALVTGAECPRVKTGCARDFSKTFVYPAGKEYPTLFKARDGEKLCRRREAPHLSYAVDSLTATSPPTRASAKGQSIPYLFKRLLLELKTCNYNGPELRSMDCGFKSHYRRVVFLAWAFSKPFIPNW